MWITILATLIAIFGQAGTINAQWATNGNNINNTNSGNVGIGTTSPASPLEVRGNAPATDYATVRVKPTVTHGGIVLDSANDTSQVHLRFFKNGTPKWQFRAPSRKVMICVSIAGQHRQMS